MNQLSPLSVFLVFVLSLVFQAGGFFYVTRIYTKRIEQFEEKLNAGLLDIAWIKGNLRGRAANQGGKKR